MKNARSDGKIELRLRDFALTYPESTEDFPWDHRAIKVRGKMFVILGTNDTGLFVTVKLRDSHLLALQMPFTEPTGYGLGKHGWVSAQFPEGTAVPVELLEDWIDESFRVVAPKTLAKLVQGQPGGGAPKATTKKKPPAKKVATKKPATKTPTKKVAKKKPAKKKPPAKKVAKKRPAKRAPAKKASKKLRR